MKKLGKIGLANVKARRLIAEICEAENINRCELKLPGCKQYLFLAPAHRHKREYYKGDVAKLADKREWVAACVVCHDQIEVSRELTDKMFKKLRP